MKLETFLNRRTPHICVRKLVRKRVPMYVKTNRKDEEDEERKRRRKRRGKKSPRPTYKADRRIKLSRAVKARARYLRSDWSAAVHLWRPPLPPPRSPPVLSFSSFPIADVVPAEGDLSSARTRCRGYSPCFFSRRLATYFSLFLSRTRVPGLFSTLLSSLPFDLLLRSSSPRFSDATIRSADFSPAENGPSATLSARDDVGLIKFRSFH